MLNECVHVCIMQIMRVGTWQLGSISIFANNTLYFLVNCFYIKKNKKVSKNYVELRITGPEPRLFLQKSRIYSQYFSIFINLIE